MYSLKFSQKALKDLSKLDKSIARLIVSWLIKNIDNCDNPRIHGKSSKGNLCGFWRYRVGDYRILCTINDGELVVQAITIGHRKEVYL